MFKTRLNIFKADELKRLYLPEVMTMMLLMRVVIPQYAPIIAGVKSMIDIGKVVTGYFPRYHVYPYFPPQLPIAAPVRNFMGFINHFFLSHDAV
ncbi:hypothetical protein AGMMS50256_33360 [Betaproteobacteria bacterium]|nr:hypothetical protein AGMMS50256_33360 [Betaproteobacteria bacterium]